MSTQTQPFKQGDIITFGYARHEAVIESAHAYTASGYPVGTAPESEPVIDHYRYFAHCLKDGLIDYAVIFITPHDNPTLKNANALPHN